MKINDMDSTVVEIIRAAERRAEKSCHGSCANCTPGLSACPVEAAERHILGGIHDSKHR